VPSGYETSRREACSSYKRVAPKTRNFAQGLAGGVARVLARIKIYFYGFTTQPRKDTRGCIVNFPAEGNHTTLMGVRMKLPTFRILGRRSLVATNEM
jgi:hypothetical protein